MLFKDFIDQDLPCEECPLYKADICNGGCKCFGGAPIEPLCCSFKDDTDMDEWVTKFHY